MSKYDVIVIGAGPAGYVAAIRCAQLGMKAACIDDWCDSEGNPVPGGTCLNAGCIPSKALLESSELYEQAGGELERHGIKTNDVTLDVAAMIANKEKVVHDLTSGIVALFKSNAIDWLPGRGQLLPDRQVTVTAHDGSRNTVSAEYVILATGSVPIAIDAAPLQGDIIVDSSGALN